jgi:hypothetical protein
MRSETKKKGQHMNITKKHLEQLASIVANIMTSISVKTHNQLLLWTILEAKDNCPNFDYDKIMSHFQLEESKIEQWLLFNHWEEKQLKDRNARKGV